LRLHASEAEPLWLIHTSDNVAVNGNDLAATSVWYADEPVDVSIGRGGELLIAYEGSFLRASG
jgi:hypothetical protein